MVTYSVSAVRGLVCTLVNAVFDEPVPLGTICPQEWRRGRLLDVIGEAFADKHGPPDGSMPWHKWMPATASAAAPAAARDAERATERQWQLDRLVLWLSDPELKSLVEIADGA